MKYILYILSFFLGTQLMAQNGWGKDFYEERAKYHFDSGTALFDAIKNVLQIDDKLAILDTSNLENRIVYQVLNDQKKRMLQHALLDFENVIDNYPESIFFNLSIQSKGEILIELNELDRARIFFTKLIKQDLPFEIEIPNENDIPSGDDTCYYDFKNTVYLNLAEIEYQTGNYSKAIEYLDMAEKFRYVNFCNNMYKYHEKEVATSYAKNYFALGDIQKAIDLVIPHIFSDGHFLNESLIDDAIKYLLHRHSRSYLIEELKLALENCTVESIEGLTIYSINYPGHPLEITTYQSQKINDFNEEIIKVIENEFFYKQLIKEVPSKPNTTR